MCGIFGWVKPKSTSGQGLNLDRITRAGMLETIPRGRDATGFYTPGYGIVKDAVIASDFPIPTAVKHERLFIGHCRAGSIGSNTNPLNAHPFECGDFIIVHNGTIRDIKPLPEYEYEGDTDSEILASYIHKHGVKVGIEKSSAMGALVIYDAGTNRLYFWSSDVRPMEICRYKGMIFFGSTRAVLRSALKIDKIMGLFDDANWYKCGGRELLCFDMRNGLNKFRDLGNTKEPPAVVQVQRSYTYGSHYTPAAELGGDGCGIPNWTPPTRRESRFRSGSINPPSNDENDMDLGDRFGGHRPGW